MQTSDKFFNFPDFTFLICLWQEKWEKMVYCVTIKFVKAFATQYLINFFLFYTEEKDI